MIVILENGLTSKKEGTFAKLYPMYFGLEESNSANQVVSSYGLNYTLLTQRNPDSAENGTIYSVG